MFMRGRWVLLFALGLTITMVLLYTTIQQTPRSPAKLISTFDKSHFDKAPMDRPNEEDVVLDSLMNTDQEEEEAEEEAEEEEKKEEGTKKKKKRKNKQRDKADDYTVDTEKMEEEEEGEEEEGVGDEGMEEDVINEQNRQVEERNKLEKLKLEVEQERRKLEAAWQKLEDNQNRLESERDEMEKKHKHKDRELNVERKRIRDQKDQLAYDREQLEKLLAKEPKIEAETEKPFDPNSGIKIESVYSKEELSRMPPADPKYFEGMDSSAIRKKYPGLTFLPGYKLQPFVLPDPHSGKQRTIDDLSEYEAEERFYGLISSRHINCDDMRRMGNSGDGGWDICESTPYKPDKDCLVYSFGINNDFSFDDAMASYYNCQVRAFDPSMEVGDHKHSDKVWFYQLGLGAANTVNKDGWKLETLGSILSKAKHLDRTIDVLKIDIEYNEWSCFKTMLKEGVLQHVRQFVFEIHTSEIYTIKRSSSIEDFNNMASMMLEIEKAGFRRFHYHYNPYGKYLSVRSGKQRTCCYELSYVNINFLKPAAQQKE